MGAPRRFALLFFVRNAHNSFQRVGLSASIFCLQQKDFRFYPLRVRYAQLSFP
jgi:hypothetical protein